MFRYSGINIIWSACHASPSFLVQSVCFSFRSVGAAMGMAQAADSKLDSVLARGKLIVGTGSTNAPWHFQGADGKLQGLISTSAG
jgi:polar amino acid transport system substrate-binding protein